MLENKCLQFDIHTPVRSSKEFLLASKLRWMFPFACFCFPAFTAPATPRSLCLLLWWVFTLLRSPLSANRRRVFVGRDDVDFKRVHKPPLAGILSPVAVRCLEVVDGLDDFRGQYLHLSFHVVHGCRCNCKHGFIYCHAPPLPRAGSRPLVE